MCGKRSTAAIGPPTAQGARYATVSVLSSRGDAYLRTVVAAAVVPVLAERLCLAFCFGSGLGNLLGPAERVGPGNASRDWSGSVSRAFMYPQRMAR